MTLLDLDAKALTNILRTLVREGINESEKKARVPKILTGTVEDLSEDLDTVFMRMDGEATGGDPMLSDNHEAPGIIPATRLGSTFTDEQARVEFDGAAGASAMQTSVESQIVLPFGTEVGQRVELKGETGTIEFYNADDVLVGFLDPTQWYLGEPGASLVRLDPLGGLRLRDEDDILRVLLSASEGLTLRDPATGISGLIARSDRLVSVDPATGDQILIGSGVSSSIPTPRWASTQAATTTATHGSPAVPNFETADDIDLRFVCGSAASNLGAATYTPPAGWTERTDHCDPGAISLCCSVATRDPAVAPVGANFVSTSALWTRRNGHTVIIRGGGGTSPAFRSASTSAFVTASATTITFNVDPPAGLVEGDLMIAFVAIAGAGIPVGWTVPEGWVQLGVTVAGLGTSHVIGSGIWFKRAGPAETAASVSINMSAAVATKVHATAVAVSNPYASTLTGLDIRIGPRSLPRGRVAETILTTNNGPLTGDTADFALNNVFLLGGRRYNFKWMTNLAWASVALPGSADHQAEWVFLLRNSGTTLGRFATLHPIANAGTSRYTLRSDLDWIPPSDGLYSFDVQADEVINGADITYQAAATVPRYLAIDDAGGTF